MTQEVWRAVVGFEGRYEVSNRGRVRSLGFVVRVRGGGRAYRKGRVLTTVTKVNGYLQVSLIDRRGRKKAAQVHQLVCEAFYGPPPPEHQVRHWDGNRAHNDLGNLLYGTAADNARDRARHGNFVCNLPGLEWCSS